MEACYRYIALSRESKASSASGNEKSDNSEESAGECFQSMCIERPTVCLSAKADKGSDDSDRYPLEVCAEKVWSEPKLRATCPDRECNLKNRIGIVLEWLPSGQFFYIPYTRNGKGADTTETLDVKECKLEFGAEDPRPHMAIIPLSKCEREKRLSDSFLSAGLDLADLISHINLSAALFYDEHIYSTVPVSFKITCTIITFVTISAEFAIAAYSAYNDFTGNVGIRKLREERLKDWWLGLVRNVFLRYLGILAILFYLPTNVQHRTAKPMYGRNVGNLCEVPYPVLAQDHVDANYETHAAFIVKLPTLFWETSSCSS